MDEGHYAASARIKMLDYHTREVTAQREPSGMRTSLDSFHLRAKVHTPIRFESEVTAMWNVFLGWMSERAEARRRIRVNPSDARRRVQRGASFLDETRPGWWRDVDDFALDLASDGACVLGLLHGSFRLGLARSGVFSVSSAPRASFSPVEMGFFCIPQIDEVLQETDYELLNRAWRDEIALRRGDEDVPRRGSADPVAATGKEASGDGAASWPDAALHEVGAS